MATFSELQTRVQQNVIDLPTTVTARVPVLIRQAIRKLQTKHDFKVCEASTGVLQTATGVRTLAPVPADWNKPRGQPYCIPVQGKPQTLTWAADRLSVEREFGTALGGEVDIELISGAPSVLLISEPTDIQNTRNFEVYPLPDARSLYANQQYRIVVPYWRFLPELVNPSDTNWFTNNAEEWIEYQATGDAFFANWDDQHAITWTTRARAEWQDILLQDKYEQLAMCDTLVPQRDVLGSRLRASDSYPRRL